MEREKHRLTNQVCENIKKKIVKYIYGFSIKVTGKKKTEPYSIFFLDTTVAQA